MNVFKLAVTSILITSFVSGESQDSSSTSEQSFSHADQIVVYKPRKKKRRYDSSDFLVGSFGFTEVPKRSVLAVGKTIKCVHTFPKNAGRYLTWKEFMRANRAGLEFVSVNPEQYKDPEFAQNLMAEYSEYSSLKTVVATSATQHPIALKKVVTIPLQTSINSTVQK